MTIVVDPAHGGADSGARGPSGVNEKDLVLTLGRTLRAQLAQQGYRVVMTRDGDSDPTYDERASIVNAIRDAIFITLHVSSTGPPVTARTYYYQFFSPFAFSAAGSQSTPSANAVSAPAQAPSSAPSSLVAWREAQRPLLGVSHRLADALQMQIAQQFSGSQGMADAAAVRELRSVAAPAVAVEVSSVAVPNPASIAAMATPLSAAIAKGISDFRLAQPATPGMGEWR